MAAWQTREDGVLREVGVDTLVRKSVVLFLIGLHLGNEVDEVLWLREKLELLGIDKIVQLVLNLDYQLNHIQAIETVVFKLAVEGNASLLGSAEVILSDREHVSLNLVVSLKSQSIILGGFFPESHLIVCIHRSWNQIS